MGASGCIITPSVSKRVGRETVTKPSKLFQDIYTATRDRELTKYLWALSHSSSFRQAADNLEYDDMGEVTYASLMKSLKINDAMEELKDLNAKKKEYGLIKGSTVKTFDSYQEALLLAEEINSNEKNYVAVTKKNGDGKYIIDLVNKTAKTLQQAEEVSFNNALNNELLDLLRSLGFDVSVVSDARFAGLFDPTNATFVDGLIQAIKIAKGEKGEAAFPEEVCHLLIEGLLQHPLVQRLLNTLDRATIKEILGDNYEKYAEKYNNDSSRMQKEAAGKLLAEYIQNKGTITPAVKPRKSLLSRIWNFIKGLLSKATDSQLSTANEKARDAVAGLYEGIANRSVLNDFSVESALKGEQLYQLEESLNDMQKMANRSMTITAKKLRLEQIRSSKNRYSEESKARYESIKKNYDEESYATSVIEFLQDALIDANSLVQKLKKLGDDYNGLKGLKTTSNMSFVKQVAEVLRDFEDFNAGYLAFVRVLSTVANDENRAELGIKGPIADNIAEAANKVLKVLNTLGCDYAALRYNAIYAYMRTIYGEDRAREIGSKRDEIITLEQILDHANRDIGFMDRWISAMSNADDMLLTLIDKGVKKQKFERDQELIKLKGLIGKLDEDLRKAGYTSDFMFEKDANGVPTGRIISEYDFDSYNRDLREFIERKREEGLSGKKLHEAITKWKKGKDTGVPRLIPVYLNKDHEEDFHNHPETARYPEYVPNPAIYSKNANRIKSLPKAQQEYYEGMMALKKAMMERLPSRGQNIYKVVYISKSDIDGIFTNNDGNAGKAALEAVKKKFIRRADDLGFGEIDVVKTSISEIIEDEKKDTATKAKEILKVINDNLDNNEIIDLDTKTIESILKKRNITTEKALDTILDLVGSSNFYTVDTDFAGHKIERLPVYYSRRLKDMRMLSTDFTSSMVAYTGMAVNYAKMNEVIDILELARGFTKERAVKELEGDKDILSKFDILGKRYTSILASSGSSKNIGARIDDYFRSAIYEVRKNDMGSFDFFGTKIDTAKTLDTIKNYTGLLGLGLNVFSAMSNVMVGKLQQWIEAAGGEDFNFKDYGLAVKQYNMLLPGYLGERTATLKKNKLSLLMEMFDPMQDYYEKLRETNYYNSTTARLLAKSSELGFVGMNAGEHLLHCQTMLAMLNHIKLTDKNGKNPISLFDALEVKNNEFEVPTLTLKDGLYYEKEAIDRTTGKPVRDENGKIKRTRVAFTKDNIFKVKSRIGSVNKTLNGAFNADDKGAIHKYALGRLAMQFRQWMPGHYYRRFARAHYDSEMEQWREGYYNTLYKFNVNLIKAIRKNGFDLVTNFKNVKGKLSEHELANLRRAYTEMGIYAVLTLLCKLGGRIKEKGDSWAEKMIAYQLNRMRLETGASVPSPAFFQNIMTILQSPAASIKTGETLVKVLNFGNMLDEITIGPYKGWSEWERDAFLATPYLGQLKKGIVFDESLVTYMQEQ